MIAAGQSIRLRRCVFEPQRPTRGSEARALFLYTIIRPLSREIIPNRCKGRGLSRTAPSGSIVINARKLRRSSAECRRPPIVSLMWVATIRAPAPPSITPRGPIRRPSALRRCCGVSEEPGRLLCAIIDFAAVVFTGAGSPLKFREFPIARFAAQREE